MQQRPCNVSGTVVHLAVDRKYAGYILISDRIKDDAAIAIARFKQDGVTETTVLTGDNRVVAHRVADQLGLDTYKAELLPEDKEVLTNDINHNWFSLTKVSTVV